MNVVAKSIFVLGFVALSAHAQLPAPASGAAPAPALNAPTAAAREALAPGGTLRVALYTGSPTSLVSDAPESERRGLAHDLGKALAQRLQVRFEPVILKTPSEVLAALTQGKADVSFTSNSPERRKVLDFTPQVLGIEMSYLVPAGGALKRIADADTKGMRVATFAGGTTHKDLESTFKSAQVLGAKNAAEGIAMLGEGKIDGFATHKGILYDMQTKLPGSQILDGSFGTEVMALAVPKGRDAGLDTLAQFVAQVKGDGELERMVARSGLRGLAQ